MNIDRKVSLFPPSARGILRLSAPTKVDKMDTLKRPAPRSRSALSSMPHRLAAASITNPFRSFRTLEKDGTSRRFVTRMIQKRRSGSREVLRFLRRS